MRTSAIPRLPEPTELRELISRALATEDMVAVNHDGCLSHPNGFDRVVVLPSVGTVGYLHLWRTLPSSAEVTSDAHTHPWPFVSYVLEGALDQSKYIANRAGIPDHDVFRHFSGAGFSFGLNLEPMGRVRLAEVSTERFLAGDSYQSFPREIHRAQASAKGTLTLVVRPLDQLGYSTVYRPLGKAGPEGGAKWPRLTSARVREILETTIGALENHSSSP